MPIWIIVGGVVAGLVALTSASSRDRASATRTSGAPVPSALEVFNAFMREGKAPPYQIAELARDEARAAGIHDLADDIERTFGVPAGSPKALPSKSTPGKSAPISVGKAAPKQPSDAALIGLPAGVGGGSGSQSAEENGGLPDLMSAITGHGTKASPFPMKIQNTDGNGNGIGAESPIPGLSATQWDGLCTALAREPSSYDSQHKIGRYRQDKRRLAELGIDPARIANDPDAQDHALELDLTDAYKHLINGRVVERVVGRPIVIPDMDEAPIVTVPGLLGVCMASGLEGCASWLRSKSDRVRYRHTTKLFLRCNQAGLEP
jgi:hypothetical protein